MQYEERYDHVPDDASSIREALEPYLAGGRATRGEPVRKLSISLPAALLAKVEAVATETGTPVSGVIAAALRRVIEEVEQTRLDADLQADAADAIDWSRASAPEHARLVAELEW